MPATASTQQTCTSVGALGRSGALAEHQEFVSTGFGGLQVPGKGAGNVVPEGPLTAWRPVWPPSHWVQTSLFPGPPMRGERDRDRRGSVFLEGHTPYIR